MEQLGSWWVDFCEIWHLSIFQLSVKIQVPLKYDITGTLHEDLVTFLITSHPVLLGMRNVLDKSCRENQIMLIVG